MADVGSTSSGTAKPRLGPRSKIVIPEAFTKAASNGRAISLAPASERTSQEKGLPPVAEPAAAVVAEVATPAVAVEAAVSPKTESPKPKPTFEPISPGLSSVKLPLGPSPKNESVSGFKKCYIQADDARCGVDNTVRSHLLAFVCAVSRRIGMTGRFWGFAHVHPFIIHPGLWFDTFSCRAG